jgi:hypothetical protein
MANRKLHSVLITRCAASKLRRLRQTVCAELFPSSIFCYPSRVRIGFGVVLVAVNLAALPILLMLDLVVLSRREMSAIRRTIIA